MPGCRSPPKNFVKAAVGAEVGLYIDHRGDVGLGDEIRTTSGRRYLVVKVRQQARGQHIGRWHLRCVVLDPDHPTDPDSRIITIWWYARGNSSRREA